MSIICSESIEEKVLSGKRLTREEGLWLWQRGDLLELAQLANILRFRHNPDPVVTFIIDSPRFLQSLGSALAAAH